MSCWLAVASLSEMLRGPPGKAPRSPPPVVPLSTSMLQAVASSSAMLRGPLDKVPRSPPPTVPLSTSCSWLLLLRLLKRCLEKYKGGLGVNKQIYGSGTLCIVQLRYISTVVHGTVSHHIVLYSPKKGPSLEDLAPPVVDQVGCS